MPRGYAAKPSSRSHTIMMLQGRRGGPWLPRFRSPSYRGGRRGIQPVPVAGSTLHRGLHAVSTGRHASTSRPYSRRVCVGGRPTGFGADGPPQAPGRHSGRMPGRNSDRTPARIRWSTEGATLLPAGASRGLHAASRAACRITWALRLHPLVAPVSGPGVVLLPATRRYCPCGVNPHQLGARGAGDMAPARGPPLSATGSYCRV